MEATFKFWLLAVAAVVELTVEMVAVAVNFDSVLQQARGYLPQEQNLRSKWVQVE
jgi:hypothetical protein